MPGITQNGIEKKKAYGNKRKRSKARKAAIRRIGMLCCGQA
jgi:hypothetical protein